MTMRDVVKMTLLALGLAALQGCIQQGEIDACHKACVSRGGVVKVTYDTCECVHAQPCVCECGGKSQPQGE